MSEHDQVMFHSPIKTPPESLLPAKLPGFDLDKGLKILNGNAHLYAHLLEEFFNQYQSSGEHLHNILSKRDFEAARFYVHSVKGITASLAATRMHHAAINLENHLLLENENDIQLDPVLKQYLSALQNSMQHLSAWIKKRKVKLSIQHDFLNKKQKNVLNHNKVEILIQNLSRQLERANPQSINFLTELDKELGHKYKPLLNELRRELNRFQFEAAAALIAEIRLNLQQDRV